MLVFSLGLLGVRRWHAAWGEIGVVVPRWKRASRVHQHWRQTVVDLWLLLLLWLLGLLRRWRLLLGGLIVGWISGI